MHRRTLIKMVVVHKGYVIELDAIGKVRNRICYLLEIWFEKTLPKLF